MLKTKTRQRLPSISQGCKIEHSVRANAVLCHFKVDMSLSVSLALVKNGKCYAKFFTYFENEDSQSRRSPQQTSSGPFACSKELPKEKITTTRSGRSLRIPVTSTPPVTLALGSHSTPARGRYKTGPSNIHKSFFFWARMKRSVINVILQRGMYHLK